MDLHKHNLLHLKQVKAESTLYLNYAHGAYGQVVTREFKNHLNGCSIVRIAWRTVWSVWGSGAVDFGML